MGIPDENWPPIALTSDVNFGYCNQTRGFEEPGYDRDGHCHGSDADSTYYWWMRDHWFRQYNGHLRCCCNWETGSDPLTAGRITNRCDYRKELQPGENTSCRDANEEHNKGFNGGCDPSFGDEQLGKPLVENDAQCWEVTRFGFAEGDEDDSEGPEDGSEDEDEDEDEESEDEESEDIDGGEDEAEEDDEEDEDMDELGMHQSSSHSAAVMYPGTLIICSMLLFSIQG